MSNEWRDWLEDRKIEAWTDLGKIAEIIEKGEDDIKYQGYFYDKYEEIKKILEEGGWI